MAILLSLAEGLTAAICARVPAWLSLDHIGTAFMQTLQCRTRVETQGTDSPESCLCLAGGHHSTTAQRRTVYVCCLPTGEPSMLQSKVLCSCTGNQTKTASLCYVHGFKALSFAGEGCGASLLLCAICISSSAWHTVSRSDGMSHGLGSCHLEHVVQLCLS